MLWQKSQRNPILIVGILMFIIFLFDLRRKGHFSRENLIPTSCNSAQVILKKRMPSQWESKCEKNTLLVVIPEGQPQGKSVNAKVILYRQLANHLSFISKNSLLESLDRTESVKVYMVTSSIIIEARTKGADLARLSKISDPNQVIEHLKNTVKVKETVK